MPILSMGTTSAEVDRQIAAFQKQKQSYERAHQEWLKGRDIQNLEDQAKNAIKEARVEASQIIESAEATFKKSDQCAKENAEAKQKIQSTLAEVEDYKKKVQDALAEAEQIRQNARNIEAGLRVEMAACRDKKAHLTAKIEKLRTFLSGFDGDIA